MCFCEEYIYEQGRDRFVDRSFRASSLSASPFFYLTSRLIVSTAFAASLAVRLSARFRGGGGSSGGGGDGSAAGHLNFRAAIFKDSRNRPEPITT